MYTNLTVTHLIEICAETKQTSLEILLVYVHLMTQIQNTYTNPSPEIQHMQMKLINKTAPQI